MAGFISLRAHRLTGLVAALVLVLSAGCSGVGTQSPTVGTSNPSPSASPVPSALESPTPAPSMWTGLRWSDPVELSAPGGLRIVDIVAWNDTYVAIGETGITDPERNLKGAFLTSPDGLDWTVAQTVDLLRSGEWMTHLFVLDGRLLATAEGGGVDCPATRPALTPDFSPELWTSTDGTNWATVDSPSWHAAWSNAGAPNWIAAGDAGLIAVGYQGNGVRQAGQPVPPSVPVVFHSVDGLTWARADLTQGFDQAVFRDAVAYPDGFVIVGRDGEPDHPSEVVDPANPVPLGLGRPAAWVSPDGIHWTVAAVDGIEIEGGQLSEVEAGADGLFAIGVRLSGHRRHHPERLVLGRRHNLARRGAAGHGTARLRFGPAPRLDGDDVGWPAHRDPRPRGARLGHDGGLGLDRRCHVGPAGVHRFDEPAEDRLLRRHGRAGLLRGRRGRPS